MPRFIQCRHPSNITESYIIPSRTDFCSVHLPYSQHILPDEKKYSSFRIHEMHVYVCPKGIHEPSLALFFYLSFDGQNNGMFILGKIYLKLLKIPMYISVTKERVQKNHNYHNLKQGYDYDYVLH